MNKAEFIYLLTGSNMGNKRESLAKAKRLIDERIGRVQRSSKLYRTQAWGDTEQEDYYNQALEIRTFLSPDQVLAAMMAIEQELGRERSANRNAPRIIDIDLLFFGSRVIRTRDLIVPHPRFHERNFAMVPMMEINGDFVHPKLELAIDELYFESKDQLDVELLD